jgi:hypothetical protein
MKLRGAFLVVVAVVLSAAATYGITSVQAQATTTVRIQRVNPRAQTSVQLGPGHVVGFSCVGRPADPGKPDEIECFVASAN